MAGPMITEKAKSFYDGIRITDKCTFFDGWLQSIKKLPVGNLVTTGTVKKSRIFDKLAPIWSSDCQIKLLKTCVCVHESI